jgi:FtsP/CotA-like multicopper oxidase with cupredoxin domain
LSRQDSYGFHPAGDVLPEGEVVAVEHAGTHQIWPKPGLGPNAVNFDRLKNWPAAGVDPILYHIRLQVNTHKFTTSRVRPIDKNGNPISPPPGVILNGPVGTGTAALPDSVIYGFNGTFPGPMINAEYGKPALVRFENDLDLNPLALDRQDFGAPDWAFLTHLHNGHSAPESDGQPHYMQMNDGGYIPMDWVDNLYLNYPAGGDPAEIQSFLWFHDHRMHFTGANVFKGMVGLMPHYDPGMPDPANPGAILPGTGLDPGDETTGLHLPGVRTNHDNGTFDVKYDIPMALYDTILDDGVTPHADLHVPLPDCGQPHPEWWGKTFFRHWPSQGFVGDVFTVNCTAYPVLHVEPRRYRFRFLDASVARIYELALMTSRAGPVAMPGTQGQWQIPDGRQFQHMTRIASMGGLLPKAIDTDTVTIWPASRREIVVDFSKANGQTIYLTNVMKMVTGLVPVFNDIRATADLNRLPYKVPLVKIVVDQPLAGPDNSAAIKDGDPLRPMPKLALGGPITLASTAALPHKKFTLKKSGTIGDESMWKINDINFDALVPLAIVVLGRPEVWENLNGGGGWVHPMHMHMEEHTILARKGSTLRTHPDDTGREDVTNLEPSESVTFYRNFRTFTGRYVAHCHNLAHEDHNMMFGWTIAAVAGDMDITGNVTDKKGAPLAGVTMDLTGAGRVESTITDASGKYGFTGLVTGTYTITPSLKKVKFEPPSRIEPYVSGVDVPNVNFVAKKKED